MTKGYNKRPAKIVMRSVKLSTLPNTIVFSESLGGRASIYRDKLTQAVQNDEVIVIRSDDKYLLTMFKTVARKLSLKLAFATNGDEMFIKPMKVEGDQARLMLLLREPRTKAELEAKGLEVNLDAELRDGIKRGLIAERTGRFNLTEAGRETIQ